MTNIRAPYQTVTTTKNTYASMNLMDLPFVFEIPVYDGIPNETSKLTFLPFLKSISELFGPIL